MMARARCLAWSKRRFCANKTSPAQTTVEVFQEGNAEAFEDDGWHWTSTQYSESSAWMQNFADGSQDYTSKSYERRVRFVRLIPLNPSIL